MGFDKAIPMRNTSYNPYQLLFPLSLVLGVLGAGTWILFWQQAIPYYPRLLHAQLMTAGFVGVLASGFLMTAIPKFTNTSPATRWEMGGVTLCVLLGIGTSYGMERLGFDLVMLLVMVQLLIFALKRFRASHFHAPPAFLFLGFGIGSGVLGTFLALASDVFSLPPVLLRLGQLLLWYGMSLFLILGVGTQLIPMIMGTQTPHQPLKGMGRLHYGIIAIFLLLGFVMEAWGFVTVGRLVRACLTSFLLFKTWHISRLPGRGVLKIMLWVGSWMMLIGLWVMVLPWAQSHWAHIYLIGAVTIMGLGIASRVTLAHGGYGLQWERCSPWLWGPFGLLLLALLTRLAAPWGDFAISHYAYAALLWIGGVGMWGIGFLGKIIRRRNM